MNRRSFLARLGLGAAGLAAAQVLEGATLDPEKLLWVPGQKTFILPPEKTFSLYSEADLRALQRAMGVIRFYDPRGRLRLDAFDARNPHEVDKLKALSNQEIYLAIETGHDLDPVNPSGRGGAYDWRNGRGGTQYTDRGSLVTRPRKEDLDRLARAREHRVLGDSLLVCE